MTLWVKITCIHPTAQLLFLESQPLETLTACVPDSPKKPFPFIAAEHSVWIRPGGHSTVSPRPRELHAAINMPKLKARA